MWKNSELSSSFVFVAEFFVRLSSFVDVAFVRLNNVALHNNIARVIVVSNFAAVNLTIV